MSLKNKFRIKDLEKKNKFHRAAPIVLNKYLGRVQKKIQKYLDDESAENLHSMRIALRRFRYSLEIFSNCIDETVFTSVYNQTKALQDILGNGRDFDVMEEKLKILELDNNLPVPEQLYEKIILEKTEITSAIKTELTKFASNKEVNQFLN